MDQEKQVSEVSRHNQVIFPWWLRTIAFSGAAGSGLLFWAAHTVGEVQDDSTSIRQVVALAEYEAELTDMGELAAAGTVLFTAGALLGRVSTSDSAAWPEVLMGPDKKD